ELFEAVLAGADVAVITAVTLRLHAIESVTAGALFWPVESAREVFRAWADWTLGAPDSVTSVVRVLRFPDAPEVPPMFAGRAFAIIEAAVQEDPDEAARLLEPLRSLAPQIDTFKVTEAPALAALHMDPPMPVRALGRSALLRSLPEHVLDDLAAALAGPAALLTSVELRQLGGVLDEADGSATAGCRALLYAVAVAPPTTFDAPPSAAAIAAATAAFDAVTAAVEPVRSERAFAGFTEASGDPAALFGSELDRLRSAKLRWDPSDLIHANHPVLVR
ncbi:MAG: FAD-binding oxidoreductase, partial [Actinobacteria bacterium]|nr:FAD-binding oxidoreductase [Actinomycetota bacterium]